VAYIPSFKFTNYSVIFVALLPSGLKFRTFEFRLSIGLQLQATAVPGRLIEVEIDNLSGRLIAVAM